MQRSSWVFVAAFSMLSALCSTPPRTSPDDYPAQTSSGSVVLAGEFFGRSAPTDRTSYFTGHYVVVEVALFPAKGHRVEINPSEFVLHVNGSRDGLVAQQGTVVAGALKYYAADEKGFSTDIGLGPFHLPSQRSPSGNIPEDTSTGPPARPGVPGTESDPNGGGSVPREPAKTLAESLTALQLDEETTAEPRSGLLYFYWPQKIRKIRILDLAWGVGTGSQSRAVLKLVLPKP